MNDYSFPKHYRLLDKNEFIRLSEQGKKIHTNFFIATVLDGTEKNNRIGITVSKKVGNAVGRNRIKRIIREYFRHRKDSFQGIKDINIIAKKGLLQLTHRQIIEMLDKLFKKIAST